MLRKCKQLLIAFWELILYGNFWIALGAASTALITLFIAKKSWEVYTSVYFLFFSTLLVYSLHRIVGLNKAKKVKMTNRYKTILSYRKHILAYAGLGFLGSVYFFFDLVFEAQLIISCLGLVSLTYVLPVFNGKRLRDFDFVKVFLVAIVWSSICIFLPLLHSGIDIGTGFLLFFMEYTLYVFAITLPFDIRDKNLDAFVGVKTLVRSFGANGSKRISQLLLVIAIVLAVVLDSFYIDIAYYSFSRVLMYIILIIYINYLRDDMDDYYFSGVLDGSLILGPISLFLLNNLFN